MKKNSSTRGQLIRALVLAHDMVVALLAFLVGAILRLGDGVWPFIWNVQFALAAVVFAGLVGAVSLAFGLNRGVWRYASVTDLVAIIKSATLAVALFALAMFMVTRLDLVPRSSLIIAWAFLILFMSGTRLAYRLMRNRRARRQSALYERKSAVLIGADANAELLIKLLSERAGMRFAIHAVLDDRSRRTGLRIRGVPVVGSLGELEELFDRGAREGHPIDSLIMTKRHHAFEPGWLDAVIEWGGRNGLEMLQAPDIDAMSDPGHIEPKPLQIQDLLGRPAAQLDTRGLADLINGMTVLVTGAGGSIGSELCRQIGGFGPKRLILLDHSEYNLYQIDSDMRTRAVHSEVTSLLCDVREPDGLAQIFGAVRPELVFHAAALKHVPIVERQPLEGLRTNVLGTCNVANAALASGARAMVVVSTDKAINPTSVMGASKRMAELYCQSLDLDSKTRFVTVRFGNVLGSSGSVVPLFERQIRAGGPVTVTHPEITRYFMTIPEASQLVLHAMEVATRSDQSRGHVHVLDMGEPVKIVNLARRMIMLSGLRPDVDIAIKFTGLRPGEKLYEELFASQETEVATECEGVMVGTPLRRAPHEVRALVADLKVALDASDEAAAIGVMCRAVPEATLSHAAAPSATSNVVPMREKPRQTDGT